MLWSQRRLLRSSARRPEQSGASPLGVCRIKLCTVSDSIRNVSASGGEGGGKPSGFVAGGNSRSSSRAVSLRCAERALLSRAAKQCEI